MVGGGLLKWQLVITQVVYCYYRHGDNKDGDVLNRHGDGRGGDSAGVSLLVCW